MPSAPSAQAANEEQQDMFASILHLPRSVLLSMAVIGGALALLAAGGTFAVFTESDTDTGTVTAGNVEITVEGTGAPGLVFNGASECPAALAPGDTCQDVVTVLNVGSLDVTLGPATATTWSPTVTGPWGLPKGPPPQCPAQIRLFCSRANESMASISAT